MIRTRILANLTIETSSPKKSSSSGRHGTFTILSNIVNFKYAGSAQLRWSRTYDHKSGAFCTQTGCTVTLRHVFWVRIPSSYHVKIFISIRVRGGTAREGHAALNPICHLLALLGAHHILHISRIRVKCEWIKRGGHEHTHRLLEYKILFTLKTLQCSGVFNPCVQNGPSSACTHPQCSLLKVAGLHKGQSSKYQL